MKKLPAKTNAVLNEQPDESYSNLNTKKKDLEDSNINLDQSTEIEVENEQPQPAGIKLRRSGYYTIPNMSELAIMVDQDGNLNVENFTIGKKFSLSIIYYIRIFTSNLCYYVVCTRL